MAFGVLTGIFTAIFSVFMVRIMYTQGRSLYNAPDRQFFQAMAVFYIVVGVVIALIGVLAIVGGVFALKRRHWGLALAGAIAGTVTFFPCGIPAIIYVTMGKPEFSAQEAPASSDWLRQ